LESGEELTLTNGDVYYWPEYSNFSGTLSPRTPVYVQVDSANADTTYGAVLESHEIVGGTYNNISGPVYLTAETGRQGDRETRQGDMGTRPGRMPERP
jgi:hypothetical protein